MGTPALIGFIADDGTVNAVCCHCDGEFDVVGRRLFDFYQDTEKIIELVEEGGMWALGKDIGEKHDPHWVNHYLWGNNGGYPAADRDPRNIMCDFWIRDFEAPNDPRAKPLLWKSVQQLQESYESIAFPFIYLFWENEWWATNVSFASGWGNINTPNRFGFHWKKLADCFRFKPDCD